MEEALKVYLQHKMPSAEGLELTAVTRMTEGFSHETLFFGARWREGSTWHTQEFVLRMQPEEVIPPYGVARQFHVLKALYATPVPVPRVFWLETDLAVLGRPFFIMEKVEGEVPLPWGVGGQRAFSSPEEQRAMGEEFVQVLAHLHTVDWQALGLSSLGVPKTPTEYAESTLARFEGLLREHSLLPQPLLTEAARWLRTRIPPAPRTSVVHGDYRLGNFIWRNGRIAAFLDWEGADLGDPLNDIGWLSLKRFQGRSGLWVGLISREDFLRRYQELTSINVEPQSLHFWEAMNAFKLAIAFVIGVWRGAKGKKADIRPVAWEFDLSLALNDLAQLMGV